VQPQLDLALIGRGRHASGCGTGLWSS